MHVRCVVDILNLVVNDSLKKMHESTMRVRNAAKYVHASSLEFKILKNVLKKKRLQTMQWPHWMFQLDETPFT